MKVKDLLSKLSTLNPEYDILCYSEDDDILPDNHIFRLFEINSIDITEAEKTRTGDDIPSLKLGKSQNSTPHVLIDVTAEF